MRKDKYTVVHPNGKVESIHVPIFSPFEVSDRLPHSLVFLHVPKGASMFVDFGGPYTGGVNGPAVVYVKNEKTYLVPHSPASDSEAYAIWRDYVHCYDRGPVRVQS